MLFCRAQGALAKMDWEQRDYILIVEDDDDMSENLTDILQEQGHRVVSFRDARLALDYLRQKSILPRLIFLDFLKPDMDVWQFLAEHHKDSRLTKIPIIGISGSDRVEQNVAPRLTHLLHKPVSCDAIIGAVERCAPTSF
jgi:DNA-binding NtrC family response regulator